VQHARLLLVTPDTDKAGTLRTRLTLAGYGVDWALSSALALASVQAQVPDLVLIAATEAGGLPGQAAVSLAQELKAVSDGTYLPCLLLTEMHADALEDWAASGVDDTLSLEADEALLRLRVGVLLHWKRRYQALTDSLLEMEASCTAARQASARYAAVFRQNREAMLLVGTNGQILEANSCACVLAGFKIGTLAGQPLARLCPPELLWASQMTTSGTVDLFSDPDASLVTVSGEIVPAEVRSVPVQPASQPGTDAAPAHDNSALFVVTLTDRRPERARLAQVQRAAAAETALVFSREINNPLFVISSNLELLQSALGQEDSRVQAKLGRIADAAGRLAQAATRVSALPSSEPPED